jgi:U3 small nucleolar RNA-associated protein 15
MHASSKQVIIQDGATAGASFQKLDSEAYTTPSSSLFIKSRGWCAFDGPSSETTTLKETQSSAISHVHTSMSGDLTCATVGGRIIIYKMSPENRDDVSQLRSLTRFDSGSNAYSARLRHDGRLVVAGSDQGDVRVFDSTTRSMMRTFSGHSTATKCVRWSDDGTRIISGSNDGTARIWDLSGESELAKFSDHDDHVRGVSAYTEFLWATGSYDHCVRLWDTREPAKPAFKASHGFPVEDVLVLGSKLYSAGGNTVCLWDARNSVEPIVRVCHHQKTVTCLIANNLSSAHERFILSGSLDGSIKCMEADSLMSVHGLFLTKGAILSVALTKDDWRLCLGTSEGEFLVTTRRGSPPSDSSSAHNNRPFRHPLRTGTHRYLARGRSVRPSDEDDAVVIAQKKKKLRPHETHLKSFSYKLALDAALETKEPATVAAVLEELQQRGPEALTIALSGRDEVSLEPVLAFISRYIANPRFSSLLIPICDALLTCYASALGESLAIDALITRLHQNVRQELEVQKKLLSTLGGMEMVLGEEL